MCKNTLYSQVKNESNDFPNVVVKVKGLDVPDDVKRDLTMLVQLARIKWGNLDPDVDGVLQAIEDKYDLVS